MARRNANGYGGVTKLKGKRSKPFMAYVSELKSEGVIIPPATQNKLKTAICVLLDAQTPHDAATVYADTICTLYESMDFEEFKEMLSAELEKQLKKRTFKSKQVKKPIGYFKSAAEANIALAEYNKSPYDLDKRKVTFKDVYDLAVKDARLDKKSKSAQASYVAGINKCKPIWEVPIVEMRLAHLQSIIDEYAHMSKSTLTNITLVQHLTFDYALKNDLADKDYSSFVKIAEHKEVKEKKPFTREEIKLLWENVDWIFKGKRRTILDGETVADILLILIYTGMRIDELLRTKSEDVHLSERYMVVRGTKTDNAFRLAPLHKKIIPLLERRLNMGGEYLIVTKAGERINYGNFTVPAFSTFCSTFKLEHTIHETRHTFATYTTKMDSTLRSFMIGHSTNNLTNDVYTHPEVLIPELVAEIDKIDL